MSHGEDISELLSELNLSMCRFLPQGGTWDVADVQWNPHMARKEYIVSTSSEKLYVFTYSPPSNVMQLTSFLPPASSGTCTCPAKPLFNIFSSHIIVP